MSYVLNLDGFEVDGVNKCKQIVTLNGYSHINIRCYYAQVKAQGDVVCEVFTWLHAPQVGRIPLIN